VTSLKEIAAANEAIIRAGSYVGPAGRLARLAGLVAAARNGPGWLRRRATEECPAPGPGAPRRSFNTARLDEGAERGR
jgi:hypothetical protein